MNTVSNIVILGGGTSAWLSAAYFSYNFPYYNITVVDKEIGTPVGVGEGTLMNFKPFMGQCGFDHKEWIPEIDATYKSGILFPGWVKKDSVVWHPFMMNPVLENTVSLHAAWSNHQEYDFKEYGLGMYDISINYNAVDTSTDYAYHVDCSKLVLYIQKKLENKVRIVRSEMVDVVRDEFNNVKSLVLKNDDIITGDLFLDCTGFKGLLNNNPIRNDLSDRLICDTAVAGHIPYQDREKELRPYVISEAVDCGWVWNIPVKNRIGSGLVFNRSITDPEDAKEYFVKYWNNRISKDSLKVIDWTPYYNDNIWHNNVVSIGLSAGFIEPLESTGIALIMEGIYQLGRRITEYYYSNEDVTIYNDNMKYFFEECVNFVSMHYSKTEREEPFWKIVKDKIKVSEEQKIYERQLLDPSIPLIRIPKDINFFTGHNWNTWLIQMGCKVAPRTLTQSKEESLNFILKQNIREKDRLKKSELHSMLVDKF
jgi:flavin-dependent dehydrogenase